MSWLRLATRLALVGALLIGCDGESDPPAGDVADAVFDVDGGARDMTGKRQSLIQLHQINAAALEDGAVFKVDRLHGEAVLNPIGHFSRPRRQKRRAHAPCFIPEAEVETCWLQSRNGRAFNGALVDHRGDHFGGKNAFWFNCFIH